MATVSARSIVDDIDAAVAYDAPPGIPSSSSSRRAETACGPRNPRSRQAAVWGRPAGSG